MQTGLVVARRPSPGQRAEVVEPRPRGLSRGRRCLPGCARLRPEEAALGSDVPPNPPSGCGSLGGCLRRSDSQIPLLQSGNVPDPPQRGAVGRGGADVRENSWPSAGAWGRSPESEAGKNPGLAGKVGAAVCSRRPPARPFHKLSARLNVLVSPAIERWGPGRG